MTQPGATSQITLDFTSNPTPIAPIIEPETPPPAKLDAPRGEVATVQRGEFLAQWYAIFPNPSRVVKYRADGQGLRFYTTMLKTDTEMSGQFENFDAAILKCPMGVRAASDDPKHMMHAEFIRYAFGRLTKFQAYLKHKLSASRKGFAVIERTYAVVTEGEWAGAVVYASLLDKPCEWFQFDGYRRLLFINSENPFPGSLVDQNKFSVSTWGTISNPYGEPILDEVYFDWFLKRHAIRNEAIYMEAFASPTVSVEFTPSPDETENAARRTAALEVGVAIANSNVVSTPKDMTHKLIESARTTAVSFAQYINRLDEGIARRITGATLASMASSGHSFGQAKTHETKNDDRNEAAADWLKADVSDNEIRDLIDRNFGPQDAYPQYYVHAKSAGERQAEIEIEMSEVELGHDVSKSRSAEVLQIVAPDVPADKLVPVPGINLPQPLPAQAGLAATADQARDRRILFAQRMAAKQPEAIKLASSSGIYPSLRGRAEATRKALTAIGDKAARAAKPAIGAVIKSAAAPIKKMKSVAGMKRAPLYAGMGDLKGVHELGSVFDTMFSRATDHVRLAEGDQPPDIPLAAKIALALEVMNVYERIYTAAQAAPASMDPASFVASLTDPNGVALDATMGNLFTNTHDTDIASIEAANLAAMIQDPNWRRQFPYIMVVNASDSPASMDRHLDGWVVSSDEAARNPGLLPPYHFGCQCIAVPVSSADASIAGFAGTFPDGAMGDYAAARGIPRFGRVGAAPGFVSAGQGVHVAVTMDALLAKAEEVRASDPLAWGALAAWLTWLFGKNVLNDRDRNRPSAQGSY